MSVWYPTLRRLASLRKRFNTSGSKRMAISRRARVPIGGRPTRRIARSCRSDVSGISEKSIPRRVTIRRPFLPARPPRTDDADRFDMACCPLRIRHYHNVAEHGRTKTKKSSFSHRVGHIWTIQCVGIREHRGGVIERDAMFGQIRRGLLRIPLKHSLVYTERGAAPTTTHHRRRPATTRNGNTWGTGDRRGEPRRGSRRSRTSRPGERPA